MPPLDCHRTVERGVLRTYAEPNIIRNGAEIGWRVRAVFMERRENIGMPVIDF